MRWLPIVFLCACAVPTVYRIPGGTYWTTGPAVDAFPTAAAELSGFDDFGPADPLWRRGDRALFGLELTEGKRVRRWLLHVEVAQAMVFEKGRPATTKMRLHLDSGESVEFPSRIMAIAVRVLDGQGRPVGSSTIQLPSTLLARGFGTACRNADALQERLHREEGSILREELDLQPSQLQGMASLFVLLHIIQDDPTLSAILWEVVESPSLLSVIANMGVHVSVSPWFLQAVRQEGIPEHFPPLEDAWAIPMKIEVNDTPALYARLLVTDSMPPLHLCGGIVALRAEHPTDPDLHFDMCLLAAHRGPDLVV